MRALKRLIGIPLLLASVSVPLRAAEPRRSSPKDCSNECFGDLWLESEVHKEWLHEDGKSRDVAHVLGEVATSFDAITLMRTPCLGMCPSYSVTLRSDGSVSWEGYCCVERRGKRSGTIPPWQFHRLATLVSEIGFFELEHGYQVNVTDLQAVFVSVKQGSRTKTVMDYASGGPARLWALEQIIDATVKDVQWKK